MDKIIFRGLSAGTSVTADFLQRRKQIPVDAYTSPKLTLSSSLHGASSHLFAVRFERLLCSLSSTHIFRYLLVRFCHSRGDILCHFIRTRWGHHLFRTWIWGFRWTVLML